MSFRFHGKIPASKSILNRLLVIQSYSSETKLRGESDADDVVKMRNGLRQLSRGEIVDCGSAGTTLRFLALRASRVEGTHHLSGSRRLFERPQAELQRLLAQLGVEVELQMQRLTIRGQLWRAPSTPIVIDRSISSQFASALFLNAWQLPFDLRVQFTGDQVSESYLSMTFETLRRAGLTIHQQGHEIVVPAHQRVKSDELISEPDASSAFSLAAVGIACRGLVEIEEWPRASLQPDAVFPQILERMGCTVRLRPSEGHDTLIVTREKNLKPIEHDLRDAPDLFPVLAVLCALAEGPSRLYGAPHLAHKESDRIAKTAELLKSIGREVRIKPDGLEIEGRSDLLPTTAFRFATDHDHRLAMAAAVARAAGARVEILDPQVVDKSYPGFWSATGGARA